MNCNAASGEKEQRRDGGRERADPLDVATGASIKVGKKSDGETGNLPGKQLATYVLRPLAPFLKRTRADDSRATENVPRGVARIPRGVLASAREGGDGDNAADGVDDVRLVGCSFSPSLWI